MSGVELTDDSKNKYNEILKGKQHRYVIYAIVDGKIGVEKVGAKDSTYEDFLVDLKKEGDGGKRDCRYAAYDFEYVFQPQGTVDSQHKSKLFILCWCPDDSPVKRKMLYSSSFDTLKRAFTGYKKAFQANDDAAVDKSEIEDELRAQDRI